MIARWLEELEARHLRGLTFREVRRALQALSATYVERRARLGRGAPLEGAGKRAAFALYYGPLHLLTVREVVRALGAARPAPAEVLDLGCGTGVAGAAWALEAGRASRVRGVDRSGWAVDEARWTLRRLGVPGGAEVASVERARFPSAGGAVIAAFTLNELDEGARGGILQRMLDASHRGVRSLVVEPIATRVSPWWGRTAERVTEAGGRADEWKFRVALPELVVRLGRAAGLDQRELTARTVWLPGARPGSSVR